jgi:hypothetical protein
MYLSQQRLTSIVVDAQICQVDDLSAALAHLTYTGRLLAFDAPLSPLDDFVLVEPTFVYTLAHQFARPSSASVDDDVDALALGKSLRATDRTASDLKLYPTDTHKWLLALLRRVGLTMSLPGVCCSITSLPRCYCNQTNRLLLGATHFLSTVVAGGASHRNHLAASRHCSRRIASISYVKVGLFCFCFFANQLDFVVANFFVSLPSTLPLRRLIQRLAFVVKPL